MEPASALSQTTVCGSRLVPPTGSSLAVVGHGHGLVDDAVIDGVRAQEQ